MRKRWLLVGLVFLLVPWLLVGCGVAQEVYDTAVSGLDKAQQELQSAKAEWEVAQAKLEAMQATLEAAQAELNAIQADLAASAESVSTVETDLETANTEIGNLQADVKTQQTLNLALSGELKKVKDPRHFESVAELVDWLYQDDTDTRYASEDAAIMCYILQVRALRDGYLLPVDVDVDMETGTNYWSNSAMIGGSLYWVYPWDDTYEWANDTQQTPSHPLPLD